MSYIKTGWGARYLLSPTIQNYPVEWLELDSVADELECRLDILRKNGNGIFKAGNGDIDEIRELRKNLSEIDARMHKILMEANPEWDQYWHPEK